MSDPLLSAVPRHIWRELAELINDAWAEYCADISADPTLDDGTRRQAFGIGFIAGRMIRRADEPDDDDPERAVA